MLERRLPTSLEHLSYLSLAQNKISGPIPSSIGEMSYLKFFDVSKNQLTGQIPLSIGDLSSSEFFDVSENELNGTFPPCFGQLKSLETLGFGYNLFEGVVLETYFSNLTRLTALRASQNRLRFEPNSSWIRPFQCHTIELGHWHLGPKFPQWLKFQKKLSTMDISDAGILDVLPTWFLNLPIQFDSLDLSYNQLRGEVSYLTVTFSIDLSSNRFTGPLPRLVSNLRYLFWSNNSFSGSLSELICNPSLTRIRAIDIETNLLIGEILDCWNHWGSLANLNLGSNNLKGKIPPSLGHKNLVVLNLQNNSMFGELSSTLQNSTRLIMLDLSENHFNGNVPASIGEKISNLVVLSLRSNNFDGHIPYKICDLHYLQNLDLAHNNISGVIPKCFNNLSAMATKYKTNKKVYGVYSVVYSFYLSALLVLKGREDEYGTTLGLVTNMDLSANSLTGEIPKEIGSLVGLLSLNFSGNLLTGNIQDNIGNMELMESLDVEKSIKG
ncbi:receptor-like protein EIX2 [Gossypium arboreum]|uniref:receptor-like protein EIX2 n=1 Tax=Gossypium arboreum TaxID=29729 RepID=UPI000818F37B|nr:receptor-like protein EIX2 [Gossypium arboreum]